MKHKSNTGYSQTQRVIASLMALLLSTTLLVTATYAWFVLSTAPEANNISTTVGSNGNLEIALATAEHLQSLIDNGMYEDSGNQPFAGNDILISNTLWGNLVDLRPEDYGLQEVVLKPTILNVVDNVIQTNPIQIARYGTDGRIESLSQFSATGAYDYSSRSFLIGETIPYGVRAAGKAANAELYERISAENVSTVQTVQTTLASHQTMLTDITYHQSTVNYTPQLRTFIDDLRGIPVEEEPETQPEPSEDTPALTSETPAEPVPGLVDDIEELVVSVESAYSAMLGSDSPVTDARAALDDIRARLDLAHERLSAFEDEENPRTPTNADMLNILAPILGEEIIFKYTVTEAALDENGQQLKDENGELVWNTIIKTDEYHDRLGTDPVHTEVAEDSVLGQIALICGEYNVQLSSIEWQAVPVATENGAVQQIEPLTMASTYDANVEKLEVLWDAIPDHNRNLSNLISNILSSAQNYLLHYWYSVEDISPAGIATENPDAKDHYYLENGHLTLVRDYLDGLLDYLDIAEEYMETAVIVYASSGIVGEKNFQDVMAFINSNNGDNDRYLAELIELAGLDHNPFLSYVETLLHSRSYFLELLLFIDNMEQSVAEPENEADKRNYLTWEELCSVWNQIVDLDSATVSNLNPDQIDEAVLRSISSVTISDGVLVSLANMGDLESYSTNISSSFNFSNSKLDLLVGSQVGMVITDNFSYHHDTWIYTSAGYRKLSAKELESSYYDHGHLYRAFESIYISNRIADGSYVTDYEAAAKAAWNQVNVFRSTNLEEVWGSVFADLIIDGVLNATTESTYSGNYVTELQNALSNMASPLEECKTAFQNLLLLYAAGRDLKNAPAPSEEQPEPERPLTATITNAITTGKSLDELIQLSGIQDEAFLNAYQMYQEICKTVDEAYTRLNVLNSAASLTWNEINSVLSLFFTVDEDHINLTTIPVKANDIILMDVLSLFLDDALHEELIENHDDGHDGLYYSAGSTGKHPLSEVSDAPTDPLHQYYHSSQVGHLDFDERSNYQISMRADAKNALYPIRELANDNPNIDMSDREYVYETATTAINSYASTVQDYYRQYQQTESSFLDSVVHIVRSDWPDVFPGASETCETDEIESVENSLDILDKLLNSYEKYIKYSLLLKASDAQTSDAVYAQVCECQTIPELFAVLDVPEDDPLYTSYTSIADLMDDVKVAHDDTEELVTLSAECKTTTLKSALSPVFLFDSVTINGKNPANMSFNKWDDVADEETGATFGDLMYITGIEFAVPSQVLTASLNIAESMEGTSRATTLGSVALSDGSQEEPAAGNGLLTDVPTRFNTQYSGNKFLSTTYKETTGTELPAVLSASAQNDSANYLLSDTYCFALDLLFRTSAVNAHLCLQHEAAQRLDVNNLDDQAMGAGTFVEADEEIFLDVLRLVFSDTVTGEIYAQATVNADGSLELKDLQGESTDYIIPLVQDKVHTITIWVYLDGPSMGIEHGNSVPLSELKINLQFTTDVILTDEHQYRYPTFITEATGTTGTTEATEETLAP